MSHQNKLGVLFFIIFSIYISDVNAFNFVPTEIEYQRWPYYCKAMYARTDVGKRSGYWKRIPKEDADKWFRAGDKAGGAWHYCVGLTHIDQARTTLSQTKKQKKYKGAIADITFSFDRVPESSSWWALYAIGLARAYRGLGDYDKAINLLEQSIKHHPKNIEAYSILALTFRDKKKFSDAIDILKKGFKVSDNKSSELAYFLGHMYLELSDIKNAKVYAKLAKQLGYPLSGLQKKINKLENEKSNSSTH